MRRSGRRSAESSGLTCGGSWAKKMPRSRGCSCVVIGVRRQRTHARRTHPPNRQTMSIDSSEEFPTRSRGELVSSMLDIPEAGMAVLVRGRPAAVREVRRYESDGPAVHLVDVEYLDDSEFPGEDSVLWEREIDAKVLRGGGLPRVADGLAPDDPERFAAFCDAV